MLAILSAFHGKLKSDVISLPSSSLYYSIPIHNFQPLLAYSSPLDLPSEIQTKMVNFKYEGEKQKVSLADLHKHPDKAIVNEIIAEMAKAQAYEIYMCIPGEPHILNIPILEMQPFEAPPLSKPATIPAEAKKLLKELYITLIAEAEFDALSEESEKFAKPLAKKIRELNKLLQFENDEEPKQAYPEWGSIPPASGYSFGPDQWFYFNQDNCEVDNPEFFSLPTASAPKATAQLLSEGKEVAKLHDVKFTVDPKEALVCKPFGKSKIEETLKFGSVSDMKFTVDHNLKPDQCYQVDYNTFVMSPAQKNVLDMLLKDPYHQPAKKKIDGK